MSSGFKHVIGFQLLLSIMLSSSSFALWDAKVENVSPYAQLVVAVTLTTAADGTTQYDVPLLARIPSYSLAIDLRASNLNKVFVGPASKLSTLLSLTSAQKYAFVANKSNGFFEFPTSDIPDSFLIRNDGIYWGRLEWYTNISGPLPYYATPLQSTLPCPNPFYWWSNEMPDENGYIKDDACTFPGPKLPPYIIYNNSTSNLTIGSAVPIATVDKRDNKKYRVVFCLPDKTNCVLGDGDQVIPPKSGRLFGWQEFFNDIKEPITPGLDVYFFKDWSGYGWDNFYIKSLSKTWGSWDIDRSYFGSNIWAWTSTSKYAHRSTGYIPSP